MKPPRTIRRILICRWELIEWAAAADLEQLKPEGLDLGQHAVQRGLVR